MSVTIMIEGLQRKKLGDICTLREGKNLPQVSRGTFPLMADEILPIDHVNVFNTEENTITIGIYGRGMSFVDLSSSPVWITGERLSLTNLIPDVSTNYLYHYLRMIQKQIYAINWDETMIDVDELKKIDILYPSLHQQEIWVEQINGKMKAVEILKTTMDNLKADAEKIIAKNITELVETSYKTVRESHKDGKIHDLLTKPIKTELPKPPVSPKSKPASKPVRVCETIQEEEEIPEEIEIESDIDDPFRGMFPLLKTVPLKEENIQQEFNNLIKKSITNDEKKIVHIRAMYLAHSYLEVAESSKIEALKKAYELCKDDIATGRINIIMRALEPI